MFIKSVIVLFMMFLFFSVSGQNRTDSIQVIKGPGGVFFEQSGRILKLKDLEFVLIDNKAATTYLKKAKGLNFFSNIISSSGGALIGYPIGYGISTGYFNMSMIAVGCGLVIISIPISIACNNKLKIAVDTYNSTYRSTGSFNTYDLRVGFTKNGIGLTLTL